MVDNNQCKRLHRSAGTEHPPGPNAGQGYVSLKLLQRSPGHCQTNWQQSVKTRLEGDGMSFAEFSYPLVQAWDWWSLFKKGVQLQIGGSDQFGNILAGAETIKTISKQDFEFQQELEKNRKAEKAAGTLTSNDPFGFTVPLLTTASGEKFGKSAGNAVWLDASMTSPFEL